MSWHRSLTASAVIASLLISGCSSTIAVRENEPLNNDRIFNFDQVNTRLEDVPATIVAKSGVEVGATQVHVAQDSISFWDTKRDSRWAMATNEVETIHYRDHGTGALSGFLGGLVGGIPVGLILIMINNDHNADHGLANLGIVFLSILGTALTGVVVGAAAGSPIKFQFSGTAPVKSSLPDSTRLGAP
jgi:hypothetical protein